MDSKTETASVSLKQRPRRAFHKIVNVHIRLYGVDSLPHHEPLESGVAQAHSITEGIAKAAHIAAVAVLPDFLGRPNSISGNGSLPLR